ncbi:MAG: L,D-transpeptidase family protein [Bacteroidota bacterium]|nr:L,D-transpeptidase family protein [Bacteroidota bacterium]
MKFYRFSFLYRFVRRLLLFPFSLLILNSCTSHESIGKKEIVTTVEEINTRAEDVIKNILDENINNPAKVPDSLKLRNAKLLQELYTKNEYGLLWSSKGVFNKEADSLLKLVNSSPFYGLFPSDYYAVKLKKLKVELAKDTARETKLDAARWAYNDLLSTSAFVQLIKDIKVGRLRADSILSKDTSLRVDFFSKQKEFFAASSVIDFTSALEPANKGYQQLKEALKSFLPKANMKSYTVIKAKDSLLWPMLIYKRLNEEDTLKIAPEKKPDSTAVAIAIKKYQRWKKMKEDGKISAALVSRLNSTDKEKFILVAINLDKYKLLPTLPDEYIWVNLPGFWLELRKGDSTLIRSKIICGKPTTQTPQLASAITDMITYPQWTIPESIIKKEILPALKKDPGYTANRGYSIVDEEGNEVSPYSVSWAKYKNSIPYKVVQGSGDANALGVLKFNFSNPYSVYLHDTNQRYLFDKTSRALSHGCVRVQKWKELAYYIIRKDSTADSTKYTSVDSLNSWLSQKLKKVIRVHQQLPLFIRYFTTEGKGGKLIFYEDIYEEDKRIREKAFANK